ncbi:hypothetical protein KPL76_08390 [Subtercola sp. PAMC28395]|uniref:hypothetical protein n=1 Tax=Subtercola sp. PAMC28395 TaxID=2846775 RepID=UPI001C0BA3CF|nr:hypothetical protein [Subtercola sp. PAMC28395]QWT22820.1 hypothetical protein KPL76_08390 [Subtercola sp. PAMC28395]
MAGDHPVLIPDVVHDEVIRGSERHSHLSLVLDATKSWISVRPIVESSGLVAFSKYHSFLVGADGVTNVGECGVLALSETLPGTAIIDDGAARRAGASQGVDLRGTVGLLLDAVRNHGLSRDTAGAVADDILASDYRYPFEAGRFIGWAVENGHLDYEQ